MNIALKRIGGVLVIIGAILFTVAATRIVGGARSSPVLSLTLVSAMTFAVCGTVMWVGGFLADLTERIVHLIESASKKDFWDKLLNGDDSSDTARLLPMSGRASRNNGVAR